MPQSNEERFTSINPADLPPELQVLYKSMQADYTRKRQEESAAVEAAKQEAQRVYQAYQQTQAEFNQLNELAVKLEDANKKWKDWYEYDQAQRNTTQPSPSQQEIQAMPNQYGTNPQQMSKQEQEMLKVDPTTLNAAQLAALDKYFEGKYGSTFQNLNDNLNKVQKQLGYTLQLNELYRTKGKDFEIDPQRIINAALELGTDKLDKAFDMAYAGEIKAREVETEVQKRLDAIETERKSQVMEGIGKAQADHFYTRPEASPGSYAEATQAILRDAVSNA